MKAQKEAAELDFWKGKVASEGALTNAHYEYFYTEFFGLSRGDYEGRRVLDLGCGPRGSLEWADMVEERVGLDSLADEYAKLRTAPHKMRYVATGAESIPFPDEHFDVVATFNSLDHVDSLDAVVRELKRVTKDNGLLLVIVEVNHEPSPTEPVSLDWSYPRLFAGEFALMDERRYEIGDHNIYRQLRDGAFYDSSNPAKRPAISVCKFRRIPRIGAAASIPT